MICLQCGKDFDGQRKTAKFCSAKCRVRFNRKVVEPVVKESVPLFDGFCEHFADKGFCKYSKCKHSQFSVKNR